MFKKFIRFYKLSNLSSTKTQTTCVVILIHQHPGQPKVRKFHAIDRGHQNISRSYVSEATSEV